MTSGMTGARDRDGVRNARMTTGMTGVMRMRGKLERLLELALRLGSCVDCAVECCSVSRDS